MGIIPISSVVVKSDGTKYDGAGCWSCQGVLCSRRCLGSRFGVLVVGCGNSRWLHSWKVSGMPLILVYGPIWKTIVSVGLKRGSVVHCQSCFLIPIGAKVDLDTKTLILQEIWHKSVRMVCHEGWWDWGQSDRRPAPRGIFCAHVGQECPNGFLSFVLNWNLSGVRLCMGVVWCSWPDLQCQSAINSSEYCTFLRRNVCSRRI